MDAFNSWTALIEETETEGHISKIRKVYDAFLAEFPLCYGYWKKYADHEERMGFTNKVVEVYERAVQGLTYSVDMWLHYCVFAINTCGDPDTIRRLFERGLVYVGSDFLSYPIWDTYIEYELTQQAWSRLAMIYTRILENPNQQLDRYFNSFRELVACRLLSELRTAEEAGAAGVGATGQEIKGEVHPNAVESTKPVSAGITEADELETYIRIREENYKKAKEFQSKIIGFETAIRRPYFHVHPLNPAELENWNNYLDFIEAEEDFQKVVKLYERCLIACANYSEYWIRYILHMEARGSTDRAENALARATQVFVKRRPEIHLFAARYLELSGAIPGARAAYQLVHAETAPGLLEAISKHANMEHRRGNTENACSLYEEAIATEKGKEYSQTLPQLFAQYSRFVYLVCGKAEKAREILEQALENCPPSKSLLEAIIQLESIQSMPKRTEYLDSLVTEFIAPNPDNSGAASFVDREELSSIFLEFLDHFADAQCVKKAEDRHAKLFTMHKGRSEPPIPTIRNPTLPANAIVKILAHSERKDQVRFRCVSKGWNACLRHPLFGNISREMRPPSLSHFYYLNMDVTRQLLLKFSIKDLVRYASVSNFGQELVKDPDFLKQQFEVNRSRNSAIICSNIWDENGIRSFVLLRVHGPPVPVLEFNKNSEINLGSATFRQFSKCMVLAGSVDGLVCLTNNSDFAESLIALWNPATRFWKSIPLPHTKSWKGMSVGLGYDSATKDYRIICIVPDLKGGSRIEIYSSSEDSWVEVGAVSFSPEVGLHCRCIVKGVPYWIGNDKELGEFQVIGRVSPRGLFERLRFPQGFDENFCHLVNMKDSVAVLVQIHNTNSAGFFIDLYVMRETDGNWTRLHRIGSFSCEGLWVPQCMGSGEIVILTLSNSLKGNVTVFCNPESGRLLYNDEIVQFYPMWCNSYYYSESMIHVKGMTYMERDDMATDEARHKLEAVYNKWSVFLPKDYESALHLYGREQSK